jgi:periplasmic protein CpxP/Spy
VLSCAIDAQSDSTERIAMNQPDSDSPASPTPAPAQTTPPDQPANRSRRLRRWTLAGLAAAVAGAFAFNGLAHGHGGAGCGPGGFGHHGMRDKMDPDSVAKFIDWRVSAMLSKVDATPEQKTRIADIAKAAARDLAPLREQHHAARAKAIELLTQPKVDRAALENLRGDELQLAEALSKRITQSVADAADVLTPEQRVKLAARWKERRG